MKLPPKNPEKIINDFFVSIQGYIQALLDEKADLMAGLTDFVYKAWEIPKAYKGQSSQMGFIPEYLVFETLKQYLQRKNNISFIPLVRRLL